MSHEIITAIGAIAIILSLGTLAIIACAFALDALLRWIVEPVEPELDGVDDDEAGDGSDEGLVRWEQWK